jgi:hypothetical protein
MIPSKAEIAIYLHNMVEQHLFGPGPWPMDKHTNEVVHQRLLDWGLIKHAEFGFRPTLLGFELDVCDWTMFVGHHEPSEIPEHFSYGGYITEREADAIMSRYWDDDEKLEDMLPPVLRRLYRAQGRVS